MRVAVRQSDTHFQKYKESFFADERELLMFQKCGCTSSILFPAWTIRLSEEKLMRAIDAVDQFCELPEKT